MFSALKKLVGSEQAPGRDKNIPAGLQSMNQALQRRFAKGVQYNSECGPRRRAGPGAGGRGVGGPGVGGAPGQRGRSWRPRGPGWTALGVPAAAGPRSAARGPCRDHYVTSERWAPWADRPARGIPPAPVVEPWVFCLLTSFPVWRPYSLRHTFSLAFVSLASICKE
jgi:hypothetical protein